MKVYVVTYEFYDSFWVMQVFSSKAAAEVFIKKLRDEEGNTGPNCYNIIEKEVRDD